jgi:hypothetical protein
LLNIHTYSSKLRHFSSVESVKAHYARSSAATQSESTLLNPPDIPEETFIPATPRQPGSPLNFLEPPELDLTQLWIEVMHARSVVDLDEASSTHESIPASFISASDSDASAEPFEDASVAYNPATHGLSADSFIKQRFLVDATKNGKHVLAQISINHMLI